MSIQSRLSDVSRYEREMASLEEKRARFARDRADAQRKIGDAQKAMLNSKNPSFLQGKARDQHRYQDDAARASKNEAEVARRIADVTKKRASAQTELAKEQEREARKFEETSARLHEGLKKRQREMERSQLQSLESIRRNISGLAPAETSSAPREIRVSHDAFISHASEDKEDLVRPLASLLKAYDCSIWYDEFQLKVGDSLRRSIDKGLRDSRFGIVVLSELFFAKNWPQYELDGLVAKEMIGGKVILPIWHKVTKDQVMRYSPTLADKVALNTSIMTLDQIANDLRRVIKGK